MKPEIEDGYYWYTPKDPMPIVVEIRNGQMSFVNPDLIRVVLYRDNMCPISGGVDLQE